MNFIANIFIFNHQWGFFVCLFLILFLNSFFPLQYSASKASQVGFLSDVKSQNSSPVPNDLTRHVNGLWGSDLVEGICVQM